MDNHHWSNCVQPPSRYIDGVQHWRWNGVDQRVAGMAPIGIAEEQPNGLSAVIMKPY
jgi:hypothetical protein